LPLSTAGKKSKPPRSDLKGVQILIVEDNWHLANSLKSRLETEGIQVSGPAATMADALRLAAEQKPDLAVVDINLRGETAYALIDRLHDQEIPIVIVSGYAVLPRLAEKVVAILQKPLNARELLEALRGALLQ
jgi:DNA-binding response OmpR family regulator